MRYGFSSEAMSFVNRILDIAARSGINGTEYNGPINSREDEDRFNAAMGGNPSYGYKNIPLVSAMWAQADLDTDWSGESEGFYEANGPWPWFYEIWSNLFTTAKYSSEDDRKAEDAFYDGTSIIIDVENKIYLAMLVAGAIRNLEGDSRNIWDLYPQIIEEFKTERSTAVNDAIQIMKTHALLAMYLPAQPIEVS